MKCLECGKPVELDGVADTIMLCHFCYVDHNDKWANYIIETQREVEV
jgi:NMD protein affecting ribosome stability and mRNA decay